jgi:RecA-family ATPase
MKPLPHDFHNLSFDQKAACFVEQPDSDVVAEDGTLENYEDTIARIVPDVAATAALPMVAASSLAGKPIPLRSWHVEEMIPGRTVTILGGDGGIGKSLIAKQLSVATVAGTPWLGRSPVSGPAIYVSAEDDLAELHRRLDAIARGLGVELADLVDLHLVPLAGRDAVMATPEGKGATIAPTAIWRALSAAVHQVKPRRGSRHSCRHIRGQRERPG